MAGLFPEPSCCYTNVNNKSCSPNSQSQAKAMVVFPSQPRPPSPLRSLRKLTLRSRSPLLPGAKTSVVLNLPAAYIRPEYNYRRQ